jgi:hypothetical protein
VPVKVAELPLQMETPAIVGVLGFGFTVTTTLPVNVALQVGAVLFVATTV